MVSASARRDQVAYATGRGLSCRRACKLLHVARSSLAYRSRKALRDVHVIRRMHELSAQYPRWGYRRIRVMLARDGFSMSPGRAYRLWRQEALQVPKKRKRRRIASCRPRPATTDLANKIWAYDFVFDACANGQKLKCLTVVDEGTREALCIDVAGSIRAKRVIEVLSKLVSLRGAPDYLRSDNGPEFVSLAVLGWLQEMGIRTAFIDRGKPWQNGKNESFNGKFRDECLNMEWFVTRRVACVLIEKWRVEYNKVRPHSALNDLTPEAFRKKKELSNVEDRAVR